MFAGLCLPLAGRLKGRGRGGWRQRDDAAEPADRVWPIPRAGLYMLKQWGDGDMSGRNLVTHCWFARADGEVPEITTTIDRFIFIC